MIDSHTCSNSGLVEAQKVLAWMVKIYKLEQKKMILVLFLPCLEMKSFF